MNNRNPKSSFFVYSPSSDTHILLSRHSPEWVQVNNNGLSIACAFEAGESVESVARQMAARYKISHETAEADAKSVYRQLCENGLITERPEKPVRVPKLDSAYLHITRRCNLSCMQCYVDCPRDQSRQDLPTPTIMKIIEDLADSKAKSITISGGEPLLHPNIRSILNHASKHLTIRLLTNGTLISPEWAAFLSNLDIDIQISIDGATEAVNDTIRGKGTYDQIIKAVDRLKTVGLGARLIFCTTVTDYNLHELQEIIALARRLEVPQVRFLPLRKVGTANQNWNAVGAQTRTADHESFYDHVHNIERKRSPLIDISCGLSGFMLAVPPEFSDGIWCSIGRHLVVDTNGDTFPCVLLMKDEFLLGNVYKNTLSELITSEKMLEMANLLVGRRDLIEKCADCHFQNLCQAGCMGQAMDNTGTLYDVDDYCGYRKTAYQQAFCTLSRKG